jgi:anti-anti-sigma factor
MKCSVKQEAAGARVYPEGDIDLHVAPEFRKILHKVLEGKPSSITVDLSGVRFVDSSGIATIVEIVKLTRQRGGSVKVEGCGPTVRDTFEIAGLTKILGIA